MSDLNLCPRIISAEINAPAVRQHSDASDLANAVLHAGDGRSVNCKKNMRAYARMHGQFTHLQMNAEGLLRSAPTAKIITIENLSFCAQHSQEVIKSHLLPSNQDPHVDMHLK